MPLIECPDCKKKISDSAAICISCGRKQHVNTMKQFVVTLTTGIASLAVGIFRHLWSLYNDLTTFIARQHMVVRLIMLIFVGVLLTIFFDWAFPISDYEYLNEKKRLGRQIGRIFIWLTMLFTLFKAANDSKKRSDEQEKHVEAIVCGNCGCNIQESDKFCKYCGSPDKTTQTLFSTSRTEAGREEYLKNQKRDAEVAEMKKAEKLERLELRRFYSKLRKYQGICDGCGEKTFEIQKFCSNCGSQVRALTFGDFYSTLKKEYPNLLKSESDLHQIDERLKVFDLETIVEDNFQQNRLYSSTDFIKFFKKIKKSSYCCNCSTLSDCSCCEQCGVMNLCLDDNQAFEISNAVFSSYFESIEDFKAILAKYEKMEMLYIAIFFVFLVLTPFLF